MVPGVYWPFPGSNHPHKGDSREVVLAAALEGFLVEESTETVPWQYGISVDRSNGVP